MTDSKALIERLRADWPEILVEKHWMMDSDAIEEQRQEAADYIEKLEADNARLREALEWALCEIRSDTRYDNEEQFWNAYDLATDALHSGKDEK